MAFTEVTQSHIGRQSITEQLCGGVRKQNLAAVSSCQQAGDAIERRPTIVAGIRLRRSTVERHAHQERVSNAPVCALKHGLSMERGSQRVGRIGERRADSIAEGLKDMPATRRDRLLKNRIVACKRSGHRIRVLLPQPSTAHDVGKQESYDATRQWHSRAFGGNFQDGIA